METTADGELEHRTSSTTYSKDILSLPLTASQTLRVTLETKGKPFEWRTFKGVDTTALAEQEESFEITLPTRRRSYAMSRWEKMRSAYLDKTIQPLFHKSYYLGIIADVKSGFIWKVVGAIAFILLGWDRFWQSYFVIAGLATILDTADELNISRSLANSLFKKISKQIVYLFMIVAVTHVCILLRIQMGQAEAGMRNAWLGLFAVINLVTIASVADKLFGVAPAIKRIIGLFK